MSVTEIIAQLAATKSKNEKEKILRENAGNEVLKRTFEVAYSKTLNFFVRGFTVTSDIEGLTPLEESIELLVTNIAGRVYTGEDAKSYMAQLVATCSEPKTILGIINRDLECGVQTTQTNKVWKDLINDPPYQSYTLFKPDLLRKFKFPGYSDDKYDGLYADVLVWPDQVLLRSRSGKELSMVIREDLANKLKMYAAANGPFVTHSEGLVIDDSYPHGVQPREVGNGYLNQDSENIDPEIVRLVVWDIVTMDEYIARKSKTPYKERRINTQVLVDSMEEPQHFQMVQGRWVKNMREAIEHFISNRKQKKEGTVLKEQDMPWGDNKTKRGIKLKNEFDVDLVVVGTIPHKKKPEWVGSLICQTSDGLLEVGVGSGLTDELRGKGPEFFIGKIVTVKANDTTDTDGKLRSLFLPRLIDKFVEIRYDKTKANTLEEVIEASDSLLALLLAIVEEEEKKNGG